MGYMLYYSHNPEWYELSKWVSSGDRGTFEKLSSRDSVFPDRSLDNFDGWGEQEIQCGYATMKAISQSELGRRKPPSKTTVGKPRGTRCPWHKLTEDEVIAIRADRTSKLRESALRNTVFPSRPSTESGCGPRVEGWLGEKELASIWTPGLVNCCRSPGIRPIVSWNGLSGFSSLQRP